MHRLNRKVYILALCLSALAGFIDAIGFIKLGGYFISFMSGNSTRLAVNLVSGNLTAIMQLAAILLLFVAGTVLGVLVRHFSKPYYATVNVLFFVSTLLTCAVLSNEVGWGFTTIALMTLAMGAENAVLQRNGEVMGLTYMTGTLVKIGQRLAAAILGRQRFTWVPYMLLWLSLISGGIIGTLSFYLLGMRSLWLAVLWIWAITIAALLLKKRLKNT